MTRLYQINYEERKQQGDIQYSSSMYKNKSFVLSSPSMRYCKLLLGVLVHVLRKESTAPDPVSWRWSLHADGKF